MYILSAFCLKNQNVNLEQNKNFKFEALVLYCNCLYSNFIYIKKKNEVKKLVFKILSTI